MKQTEDIAGSSTKSNRSQLKRRSHSKFIPPRSAKKLKTTDTNAYTCVASTSTGDHSKEILIELSKEKKQLMEKLHEKENKLQKLRLVRLYRTKVSILSNHTIVAIGCRIICIFKMIRQSNSY